MLRRDTIQRGGAMFKLKIVTDKRTRYELAEMILIYDEYLAWKETMNLFGTPTSIEIKYEKEGEDWKLASNNGFTEKLIFLQIDNEIVIGGAKHGN